MSITNKRLRDAQRILHLAGGGLLLLSIYTSLGTLPVMQTTIRFVVVPLLVISGLAMWQLPRWRRWLAGAGRRSAPAA